MHLWVTMMLAGCTGEGSVAPPDVFINEFMADNETIIPNEEGDYVDWIELYNAADEPVSTADLFLSDDLDDPTMFALPDLEIAAGGYLLLWADKQTELSDYHLPFSLSRDGEEIGLSYLDDGGDPTLLDGVQFSAQESDISWGRQPDGGSWTELAAPSPGMENN